MSALREHILDEDDINSFTQINVLNYYNSYIHKSAFALLNFVKENLLQHV